ncbi:MAG: ATP-binding cassette domain-containing protein [Halieaceae bacterium]
MTELLKVEKLWKKYSVNLKSTAKYAARDILRTSLGFNPAPSELRDSEFWALRDINLDVKRGEVLGILGRNGAGKSTLLKCIANKVRADRGSIDINGELGHLIEMSAGFSPTMTGRDNVKVRGKLIGKSGTNLNIYVDRVAEFADIGEFFDAPVQIYSSGMRARVGFAASVFIDPDILIIDEVLAVGDLSFRLRCYDQINELTRKAAVIFVSHSLGHIARLCNRGLYLHKGETVYTGDIQQAIRLYQDDSESLSAKSAGRHTFNEDLVSMTLLVNEQRTEDGARVNYGDDLGLHIDASKLAHGAQIRILLKDSSHSLVSDWNSFRSALEWPDRYKLLSAELGKAELNPGSYSFTLQIMDPTGVNLLCMSNSVSFMVKGTRFYDLPSQRLAKWDFNNPDDKFANQPIESMPDVNRN